MTTKLEGPLKREVNVGRETYTLTISPTGFLLALKGRRKGIEIAWSDLLSGDAALTTALNASLHLPFARAVESGPSAEGKASRRLGAAVKPTQTRSAAAPVSTPEAGIDAADGNRNDANHLVAPGKKSRKRVQ